jgi:hypothetical protein
MKIQETNREAAHALALSALGWTLTDEARAQRLLALTGLTPKGLRERLAEERLMAAVLRFLEAHEPDLVACAAELEVSPLQIVAAREALER